MPSGLDIDRTKDLNGTMAAHDAHLMISTGQSDWTSKIEDERDSAPWGSLVANLKKEIGPKGQFYDVCDTYLMLNRFPVR